MPSGDETTSSSLYRALTTAFAKNGRASGHALQRSFAPYRLPRARIGLTSAFQNAGRGHAQVPIEELSLDAFQQVINVNLVGTFLCTREAVRIFKSQTPQGGASIASFIPSIYRPNPV